MADISQIKDPNTNIVYDLKDTTARSELSGKASSSHSHGNITNAGAITSDTSAASGDKLILADSSDSSKLIRSEISFDASTTTKALTPKGTWETFAASSHNHAAGDITSGTLGAARGGTGQTSLQATRNAMGLGNTTGALPVANGGTGSTARTGNTGAVHSLFNENVGSNTTHFLTIKSDWSKVGYCSNADAWTALGGGAIGKKASLAASDIPNLAASKITSGTLALDNGGTGGTDSGWDALTNDEVFTGTIWRRKIGPFVTLYATEIKLKTQLNSTNYVTIADMSASWAPKVLAMGSVFRSGKNVDPGMYVKANGNIVINAGTSDLPTTEQFHFCISYITV